MGKRRRSPSLTLTPLRRRFMATNCSMRDCARYMSSCLGRVVSSRLVSSLVNGVRSDATLEALVVRFLDEVDAMGGMPCPYCQGTGKKRVFGVFQSLYLGLAEELSSEEGGVK